MSNKIRPSRSEVTGAVPANGDASVSGELHINIIDRKVYQKDATGTVQLVADRIDDYSDQKQYAAKDFCVYDDGEGDKLYRCNTAITTPETWDPAKWDLLGGGGGGDLDEAIIKAPDAAGRNTIDTSAGTDIEALVIQGPTTQAADLIRVEGTQAGDTGALVVDSLGFPGQRFGAAAHRATTSAHSFTAVGQAAALSGVNWIPAQHGTNDTLAIFQEGIEPNTFVLRQAGLITGLDTTAFAGGVISPNTYYYTSDTVPGQLTTFQAAGAPAVLFTTSATEGLVLTGNLGAPRGITTGDTFPSPAELGALHYMTAEPVGLYVLYDDGDSVQWVQTNGGASVPKVNKAISTGCWLGYVDTTQLYLYSRNNGHITINGVDQPIPGLGLSVPANIAPAGDGVKYIYVYMDGPTMTPEISTTQPVRDSNLSNYGVMIKGTDRTRTFVGHVYMYGDPIQFWEASGNRYGENGGSYVISAYNRVKKWCAVNGSGSGASGVWTRIGYATYLLTGPDVGTIKAEYTGSCYSSGGQSSGSYVGIHTDLVAPGTALGDRQLFQYTGYTPFHTRVNANFSDYATHNFWGSVYGNGFTAVSHDAGLYMEWWG